MQLAGPCAFQASAAACAELERASIQVSCLIMMVAGAAVIMRRVKAQYTVGTSLAWGLSARDGLTHSCRHLHGHGQTFSRHALPSAKCAQQ